MRISKQRQRRLIPHADNGPFLSNEGGGLPVGGGIRALLPSMNTVTAAKPLTSATSAW
jgi:hypothetical protein